jgi:RNA polymerase sigma-70 factor, ECF subfamily
MTADDEAGDDRELLRALGRGDPEAVALLYRRHGPKMLAFARRYVIDQGAAEDVVIDLLRRWLERPPSVREFERLRAFLATSVYHAAVDWIRRDRAEQGHSPRSGGEMVFGDRRLRSSIGAREPAASPEAMRTRLAGGLQRLPNADRLLLETHYGHALTPQECMNLLGISRAAFHQRLHRARVRLAAQLAADEVATARGEER